MLNFTLVSGERNAVVTTSPDQLVIAGWTGRNADAIAHHIEELAAIGVPRPSAVPLYYRVSASLLTQAARVQVLGPDSSGEAEPLLVSCQEGLLLTLASDHTDRKAETYSVVFSKQACAKPVASHAWRWDDVAAHADQLELRSWIEEAGKTVLYQEGFLSAIRPLPELVRGYAANGALPLGTAMSCGTLGAIGGVRAASGMTMELHDPVLKRRIRHSYQLDVLPVIS